MILTSNNYYVYGHFHPISKELVYIGQGSRERAWVCGRKGLPIRSEKHQKWLDELLDKGLLPIDWVDILHQHLTKAEALAIEHQLIREHKPQFNKSIRTSGLKFTPSLYDKAIKLRQEGLSYEKIGEHLELSAMTIHRGMSGKSISLETALEER